jgi:HAUS augmin-like complex subunit 4
MPASGHRPPLGAAFRAESRTGRTALTPLQQKPVESTAAMEGEESDSEELRRVQSTAWGVAASGDEGPFPSSGPSSQRNAAAQAAEQAQAGPGPLTSATPASFSSEAFEPGVGGVPDRFLGITSDYLYQVQQEQPAMSAVTCLIW